jgi:membrane protein DedA with SNARE-associated domain
MTLKGTLRKPRDKILSLCKGYHFMFDSLLTLLISPVHHTIEALGYMGVALLMAIESANIPLPSELILPYAGYLVQKGQLNIHGAAFAGALGCVLGSAPSYWLGKWGGRPFLAKYGKFLLMSTHDLDKAEAWVARYGNSAFFLCRMLPVVRTFISLPAGILKAPFWPFTMLTFVGSLLWSYALVYVGVLFGENLEAFKHIWHQFDIAIVAVCVALGLWYIWHHVQVFKKPEQL